ncbi:MAG: M1 family metallopeptidase [Nonlabens sp.]
MIKNFLATILLVPSLVFAQNSPSQLAFVDFKTAAAQITLDQNSTSVSGQVTFKVDVLKSTDSLFVDAKNLVDYEVSLNNELLANVGFDKERLIIKQPFIAGSEVELKINYSAKPSRALYFIDVNNDEVWEQAWTQGQGKYTSNWLPSIDDTNDKMIWNIKIDVPKGMKAIANGTLKRFESAASHDTYSYGMLKPMSSYLVAIAAGDYKFYSENSATGVRLQYYHYPNARDDAFTTYHDSKEIFDFLVEEIGVEYPWQVYRQVPVKDFLYSGMENTTTTFFNDQFLVDEIGVTDRDYLTVNAHELAHQWFGDLVTAQDGTDHWLQEGFATYYAMLAEREIYGNEHFQMELYRQAEALIEASKKSSKKSLTDAGASSLTFYQHGAWALHALKDLVGESRFRESVQNYLQSYAYKNASTADFIAVVEKTCEIDLADFQKTWLETPQFPTEESLRILRKDLYMEAFFQLAARRLSSFEEAYATYKEVLKDPIQKELVKEMVAQLAVRDDLRKYDLLKKAAALNMPEVNQLISLSTEEVNEENKEVVESFLDDPSYVTRENALYLLWRYSDDREKTLENARSSWDSTSPALDMAWNALALNTNGFTRSQAQSFLSELRKFTGSEYDTVTRTAAFDYLINMEAMGEQNYKDLIDASTNHVWRFYTNARELLNALYKKPKGKSQINQILLIMDRDKAERIEEILRK